MKKFLTVLLVIAVMFTFSFGSAFATAAPADENKVAPEKVEKEIRDNANALRADLLKAKNDALYAIFGSASEAEIDGVDVAKATCITIEHADRFGLAELHQLRGRVGRSNLQSYCFLTFGKNITEAGKDRLRAIYNSTDGFVIAEEDLRLRGPGEISGTNQSGYLKLSIADLARDKEVLKEARYDAFNLIKNN